MSKSSKKSKWIQSLQVGDTVCDCRYKHLKIAEIAVEYWIPGWMRRIVGAVDYCSPNWARRLDTWLRESRFAYVGEADLTLEDGWMCSANNCCNPVDHYESVHHVANGEIAMQERN